MEATAWTGTKRTTAPGAFDWAQLFEPYVLATDEAVGFDGFCAQLAGVIGPLHVDGPGVHVTSEFGWVTARIR